METRYPGTFEVTYEMTSQHGVGLQAGAAGATIFHGLGGIRDAIELKPTLPMTFTARGTASTSFRHDGATLGFLQSLEAIDASSTYADGSRFVVGFAKLPIKDGEGAPWMKPDIVQRVPANAEHAGFAMTFSDGPRFFFPAMHGQSPAVRASVTKTFNTWLVMKEEGTYAFLHHVLWQLVGDWGTAPVRLPQGLKVLSDTSIKQTSRIPGEAVFDGPTCNGSELQRWA